MNVKIRVIRTINVIRNSDKKGLVMKYQDITRKIIGCAMKVHSALGNGFQSVPGGERG